MEMGGGCEMKMREPGAKSERGGNRENL